MITYEQAKELKEAGFPMKKALPSSQYVWGGTDTGGTVYEYPTLEELIEACGDRFKSIKYFPKKRPSYYASARGIKLEDGRFTKDIHVHGNTILEAVKNLYIALNKK